MCIFSVIGYWIGLKENSETGDIEWLDGTILPTSATYLRDLMNIMTSSGECLFYVKING